MKIIIVGCGKVGELVCAYVAREGHDVVVIDTDDRIIEDIVNEHDVMGVVGNGASREVQLEAGVRDASLLIAMTASDELNIMCCLVARKLGAHHTIARVRNPEYSEQVAFMRDEFGLSMTVNPEYDAASEILRIIRFPETIRVDSFAKGRVDLVEVKLGAGNPLIGKRLAELAVTYGGGLLVCAVRRGDEVTIPKGDFTLLEDDIIHITASHSELVGLFKKLGLTSKPIKSVMIIGGGKLAYFLASQLLELGIKVKIIELDPERAELLSELLPGAMLINGDGTDSELLVEEGIDGVDATVTLTGIDEMNIIISMFAGSRKVDKVITKVNHLSVMKMLTSIGLECIISPKSITSSNILRYVRGLENSYGSSVQTLYKIVGGKAEALEFIAADGFEYLEIPLREMKLKKNLLLACIIRDGRIIYPHGSDTIEAGDSVIVVAGADEPLRDLADIIE